MSGVSDRINLWTSESLSGLGTSTVPTCWCPGSSDVRSVGIALQRFLRAPKNHLDFCHSKFCKFSQNLPFAWKLCQKVR